MLMGKSRPLLNLGMLQMRLSELSKIETLPCLPLMTLDHRGTRKVKLLIPAPGF